MGDNKKKKKTGFGFAIWLLIAIILFVVILINWGKFSNNIKESGLLDVVASEKTENQKDAEQKKAERQSRREKWKKELGIVQEENSVEDSSAAEKTEAQSSTVITVDSKKKEEKKTEVQPEAKTESSSQSKTEASIESKSQQDLQPKTEQLAEHVSEPKKDQAAEQKVDAKTESKTESKAETKTETKTETQKPAVPETRSTKLYFITTSGGVKCQEVVRALPKSDSPMTDAINAVIAGPNASEQNAGCQNFVSAGTKLLGASVKNGIATLNFNESFTFNSYGAEGLKAALKQIVYTATAFSTVDSVQFLVEGKMTDYLSEGVWVGTPLKRSSF